MESSLPERVDVVSMLKLWWRVSVRTCVVVGIGQAPAAASTRRQHDEQPRATVTRCPFSGGQRCCQRMRHHFRGWGLEQVWVDATGEAQRGTARLLITQCILSAALC